MAQGPGNGFPIGAVVAKKHVVAPMAEKFMFHTYGANPTSAATARAVLAVMRDECLQENARTVGAALLERLHDLKDNHHAIEDARGKGLMLVIEMVTDRDTKTPDKETITEVFEACRDQGVILSKSAPFQSCLRMVPPLCLTMDDVDRVAEDMDLAFRKAAAEVITRGNSSSAQVRYVPARQLDGQDKTNGTRGLVPRQEMSVTSAYVPPVLLAAWINLGSWTKPLSRHWRVWLTDDNFTDAAHFAM